MTQVTAIGIDLGTTNSCVAVVRNGQVEAIANDAGYRTTPSCVAFTGQLLLVGDAAKEQAESNPINTIYSAKRMIGQRYCDLKDDLKYWPFSVIEDDEGRPQIEVNIENERKVFAPEAISSKILVHMKDIAETALSSHVTDAVISVPAYFSELQRQATMNAAAMAGLNVLRIINEPTAAAIDYGLHHKPSDGVRNVLVFDLGGGTCDVSVLTVEKNQFVVKAIAGETRLGGDDIDYKLVEHCATYFKDNNDDCDILSDPKARHRLLVACEKGKRTLSTQMYANISVPYQGTEYTILLTRDVLDDLCRDLFNKAMLLVEQALAKADLTKDEIDDIVAVGGSTRIPKVQKLLRSYFNGKELSKTRNPDEVVARGAAIEAALLAENKSTEVMKLTDVAPASADDEEIEGQLGNFTESTCSKQTIGIDLGTTNLSVGIMIRGKVEIVPDEQGNRVTPSCVTFHKKKALVGATAVNEASWNTIFGIKQIIGRTFDDSMRNYMPRQTFTVLEGSDGLPKLKVQWGKTWKRFSPEEITSMLISRMKELTEAHIGSSVEQASTSVEGAVIAVPCCFNSSQRQAIKDAAIIAGFKETDVHLIPEPIAAAITYCNMMQQKNECILGKHTLLVFDVGGGKCEASIVAIHGNHSPGKEQYDLKWTTGTEYLGGEYIDGILALHISRKLNIATVDLRSTCRSTKEKLSFVDQDKPELLFDELSWKTTLTRNFLEDHCTPYFQEIIKVLSAAAEAAEQQIDDYILIGGTTRIPKLRALIKSVLDGKEPNEIVNPDGAVAYGAAIYADSLQKGRKLSVEWKLSKSLWIKASSGFITDVPPQRTSPPTLLHEPEAPLVTHLDEIRLNQLIPEHLRPSWIEVTLRMHEDGNLDILATHKLTKERFTLTNTTFQGCVDKEKVKQKIEERQLSEELANMHDHVRKLFDKKGVSELELKEFESAHANLNNIEGGCRNKEEIHKLRSVYENIVRIDLERKAFKRRKWRKKIRFAKENEEAITQLYFAPDDNNPVTFKVCHIIDTYEVVEFLGEISPMFDASMTPLSFVLDEDGILNVTAEDISRNTDITIRRVGCLTKEEVVRIVDEQHT